eukprot:TRINITY_DN74410_c0_g1_i1.p1 TRINITY_DN74410_c0_g1~~TRINITY_DN74410_c0_g1_i1.p1  ORF type:complete len:651 (+),score=104.72 TRINITY_DN74410_c0_g1_i1:64-2016(+)
MTDCQKNGSFVIGLDDVKAAQERLKSQPRFRRTPMLRCTAIEDELCQLVGRKISLFFKCEHLQATGSFKIRGALNSILALPQAAREKGVVSHSSGNHGQALALAARLCGIPAHVVVPHNAPATKVAAMRGYGAELHFCEPTLAAREGMCTSLVEMTGCALVPPYNMETVMAGQGTLAAEMMEDEPSLDAIVIPISGGGLISGCAVAASSLSEGRTRVFGAEPAGADDAWHSKRAGYVVAHTHPPSATICDALRINQVGDKCWPIIRDIVQDIFVVPDSQCIETMRLIYGRMKQVIEPAGAVATAALFTPAGVAMLRENKEISRIGVLICGGNLDIDMPLPWVPSSGGSFERMCRLLRDCYEEVRATVDPSSGSVYDKQKVVGLSDQSADLFGVAVEMEDGRRFSCGDADATFQLQSTYKPLLYGWALERFGTAHVHRLVGAAVSLGGHASPEAALLKDGRPHNPLINAGALRLHGEAAAAQLSSEDMVALIRAYGTGLLPPDEVALRETCAQQVHNVALCRTLGMDQTHAKRACDLYATADCVRGNCKAVAGIGAAIAAGRSPKEPYARAVRAVMLGCGLYEASPDWSVKTGLPAKSGVSGVILGAGEAAESVGRYGICVFSPPIDRVGNSVRGVALLECFCERLPGLAK